MRNPLEFHGIVRSCDCTAAKNYDNGCCHHAIMPRTIDYCLGTSRKLTNFVATSLKTGPLPPLKTPKKDSEKNLPDIHDFTSNSIKIIPFDTNFS